MKRLLAALALTVLPLTSAHADLGLGPMPGEERFAGMLPQTKPTLGADVGFAQMDGDYFLQLTLKTELNLGQVGLGLQAPLNLRVIDRDPKAHGDYYGLIRREDWDTPSEWLRVVRYARLGHKRDPVYLRVGELAADLGHGTIVNRYLNNVDTDTFRVGSTFDVNTSYGGAETLISDLGTIYDSKNPRSRIYGLRAYFKPYSLVDADSFLNIFSVGATVVTDWNAPISYQMASPGQDASGQPLPPQPVVKDGAYVVADTSPMTVYGFDVEAEVLNNALVDLVPYSDLNFINNAGWGWHAGALATLKMPIAIALTIPIRLEYRRFSSNYVPEYFDTFYEVQRFNSALTGQPISKEQWTRELPSGKGYNGVYGDLAFDFAGIVQVGAVYEAREGADASLQAFAAVPALETLQFKAFYARTGIKGTNDVFKFDDRSMLVAQGRYELFSYVYLVGRFTRRWVLDSVSSEYQSKDDWNVGLEFSLEI